MSTWGSPRSGNLLLGTLFLADSAVGIAVGVARHSPARLSHVVVLGAVYFALMYVLVGRQGMRDTRAGAAAAPMLSATKVGRVAKPSIASLPLIVAYLAVLPVLISLDSGSVAMAAVPSAIGFAALRTHRMVVAMETAAGMTLLSRRVPRSGRKRRSVEYAWVAAAPARAGSAVPADRT